MTRQLHDQFAKQYLEELLSPFGKVEVSREVTDEVRQIDILFSPAPSPNADIQSLGLLGRIATTASLSNRIEASVVRIQQCFLYDWRIATRKASHRASRLNNRRFCTPTKLKIWWSSILRRSQSPTDSAGGKRVRDSGALGRVFESRLYSDS